MNEENRCSDCGRYDGKHDPGCVNNADELPEPIWHLLKPKEFRTWCVQNRAPGPKMNVTSKVSKATCANCLTNYRYALGHGNKSGFKVCWTSRFNPKPKTPKL